MQPEVWVKFVCLFYQICNMKFSFAAMLLLPVLFLNSVTLAFETDQYNLPSVPLADIGDEVSRYAEDNFVAAVNKVNAEIATLEACLDGAAARPKNCGSADDVRKKLALLRSNDAVAHEVFKLLGDGSLFITRTGKWFNKHKFAATPDRYKTTYGESIYIFMPFDYASLSPTINLYGAKLGTDKIEHFFQQGYKYYTIRNDEIASGKPDTEAEKKAVAWGQRTERTYFGLMVSGVYSNADLYANYAGMKFYSHLTTPLKIGETTRPAILTLADGRWKVNKNIDLRETLIKPFLTDHLNEALNPSGYAFNIYPTVKRVVRDQACPEWRNLMPDIKKADLEMRSASLENWNGEDYGFARKGWSVPLAETCFGGRSQ